MDTAMTILRKFEGGRFEEKAIRLERILPDLSDLSRADSLSEECRMDRVLCHGDLWSMNTLWRKEGKELTLAALIDYQTAHFGCAATDLVRLFATCLSGKDRRAHWEELLRVFYGYLLEEIGGGKVPYTLKQLEESYRRFLPLGGYITIPMIGALFETLYKNPDEQLRRKCLEIVSEKIDCILDDIFYYHDRNIRLQKGEQVV
uniref:CHK domain-containing protein n=1 Tax=Haemonchus contortus TaxID=6289 RepID=A0A7I4YWZ4_HAECO